MIIVYESTMRSQNDDVIVRIKMNKRSKIVIKALHKVTLSIAHCTRSH